MSAKSSCRHFPPYVFILFAFSFPPRQPIFSADFRSSLYFPPCCRRLPPLSAAMPLADSSAAISKTTLRAEVRCALAHEHDVPSPPAPSDFDADVLPP